MRSAARGSPVERPISASITPTRVSSGKLWPFATNCVPDDDVATPGRDGIKFVAQQPLRAPQKIRGEHERASVREALRHLLRQPLDTGTAGDQGVRRLAHRADIRPTLLMAAMVADERVAKAMFDQPGRAIRALEPVAAAPAEGQRRVAPTVEEQERLLAVGDRLLDRAVETRRDPMAARRLVPLEVERRDPRHRAVAEPARQFQMRVAALPRC